MAPGDTTIGSRPSSAVVCPDFAASCDIPIDRACVGARGSTPRRRHRKRCRRLRGAKHTNDAIESGQLGPGRSRGPGRFGSGRSWRPYRCSKSPPPSFRRTARSGVRHAAISISEVNDRRYCELYPRLWAAGATRQPVRFSARLSSTGVYPNHNRADYEKRDQRAQCDAPFHLFVRNKFRL
jgi:hypothetical protein